MTSEKHHTKLLVEITSWIRDFSIFAAFWLVFSSAGWAFYHIPSSSMEPTLEVGDRIAVSKFAYGYNRYSVPFSPKFISETRIFNSPLSRGDVAVFTIPARDNENIVKRVIGLPGDRIQVQKGRLYINDKIVERSFLRNVNYTSYQGVKSQVVEYNETLPNGVTHRIFEQSDNSRYDNAGPFIVPSNHYFMMGDNRDNSLDSRALNGFGYVPETYFVGRADITTFSLYDCDQGKDIFCPTGVPLGRFFNSVE